MSTDSTTRANEPRGTAPERRRRLPLAPALFFLGLGTLLLSWLVFMSYYVLVKSKQPRPVPELRLPPAAGTNPAAPPAPTPRDAQPAGAR
jgi:hypothetical protein